MKVLLINGSPHIKGCTFRALEEVEKALNNSGIETEIIQLGGKDIRGCIACGKCRELKACVFNDLMKQMELSLVLQYIIVLLMEHYFHF